MSAPTIQAQNAINDLRAAGFARADFSVRTERFYIGRSEETGKQLFEYGRALITLKCGMAKAVELTPALLLLPGYTIRHTIIDSPSHPGETFTSVHIYADRGTRESVLEVRDLSTPQDPEPVDTEPTMKVSELYDGQVTRYSTPNHSHMIEVKNEDNGRSRVRVKWANRTVKTFKTVREAVLWLAEPDNDFRLKDALTVFSELLDPEDRLPDFPEDAPDEAPEFFRYGEAKVIRYPSGQEVELPATRAAQDGERPAINAVTLPDGSVIFESEREVYPFAVIGKAKPGEAYAGDWNVLGYYRDAKKAKKGAQRRRTKPGYGFEDIRYVKTGR